MIEKGDIVNVSCTDRQEWQGLELLHVPECRGDMWYFRNPRDDKVIELDPDDLENIVVVGAKEKPLTPCIRRELGQTGYWI